MTQDVSIVMPAFKAEDTIAKTVLSVIQQTHPHWELVIVADDGMDYASILGQAGLLHPGIRFLSSDSALSSHGSGPSIPRNIGLDAAKFSYVALLDADDIMHPQKLEYAVDKLQIHPIISCALQLLTSDFQPLRTVGEGADRVLSSRDYKYTNYSSDAMVVYDRQVVDPRFDPSLPCVNDVDFVLRLFAKSDHCFHFGRPLHSYVKRPISVSNGPTVEQKYTQVKNTILQRLSSGYYPFLDPETCAYMERYFVASLATEAALSKALATDPEALFEDCIEKIMHPQTEAAEG
ncbi:glycosyltransferase family 2 protein [Leptothoe sp. PORK10 BA2]|uniref:glycosyltransferase family 2 protein n=1 Tax=Leptothoe sp. PORK10 BA2 TaxID=3110254 RepID=UPI002B205F37|nr:glycosyltransferase family A protein [Leptothoe sp. PORK10 BA2]MEA5466134.1 glycosyltransferase family A protein [Leptothoe sp. PORK10 BA2]